ncbi:unnamed protein product, partial [Effrenium voratum]
RLWLYAAPGAGGCGRLATQRNTTRAQRAIARQHVRWRRPGLSGRHGRPEVSAFCCATARMPHQRRLHPASAEARNASGARWVRSRANRFTSSTASQPHRPPTWQHDEAVGPRRLQLGVAPLFSAASVLQGNAVPDSSPSARRGDTRVASQQ